MRICIRAYLCGLQIVNAICPMRVSEQVEREGLDVPEFVCLHTLMANLCNSSRYSGMAHSGIHFGKICISLMLIYITITEIGNRAGNRYGAKRVKWTCCQSQSGSDCEGWCIATGSSRLLPPPLYRKIEDGKIFIHPVDDAMRIRTPNEAILQLGEVVYE